jgi:DNA invertase Pin-like site-specific DNA recombinase
VSKQINWGGGVPIRRRRAEQQAGQDAQVRDLKAAGCEEVFSEQVSAVAQRDRLKEALRFVRRGDTVVTCRPDRLARSTTDLLRTWINGASA